MSLLQVETVHTSNRDVRWLDFIRAREPTLFQRPEWGTIVEEVYGFPACVAMMVDDGKVVGGAPYTAVTDFRGERRVINGFADVCEPVGEDVWPALEDALCKDGVPWQIRSRMLPGSAAETVREIGVHQTIDLRVPRAEVERRFNSRIRTYVRTAQRAGLVYERLAGRPAIDVFYELHSRVRQERHRLLPQPRKFFEAIERCFFPERGFVLAARAGDRYVAAMFIIELEATWYYKFSASAPDALALRPNHFLLWKAIDEAVNLGITSIDMGISEAEGLMFYKRSFGAADVPVYVARYNQPDKTEAILAVERALGELTSILTEPETPLATTQAAGAALYRFFI